MKVCNITAIKQATYIPKKETNKAENIDSAQENGSAKNNTDIIEISSEKREEIRNLLINDEKYQQAQFEAKEKKYPIINRFSDIGVAHHDNAIREMEQYFWESTREIATNFMEGKVTVDDIMNHFCDIVDEAFETYTERGYMGDFDSEKTALLNHLYKTFRYTVNNAANRKNLAEGKQYCEYGSYGCLYYNAEYYYKAKELTDALELGGILKQILQEITT